MRLSVLALCPALGVAAATASFVIACTVTPTEYSSDADTGSSHALISIERSVNVREAAEARSEAFAGFLQAPAEVDPAVVLRLTGLSRDLPELGQCVNGRERDSSMPLAPALTPLGNVNLLDVGDLAITTDGATTDLAPRAFPTVTDLVSGVVYTTRDRAADSLPAHTTYTVASSGGSLSPFMAKADAPYELEGVFVNGTPLADLEFLSPGGQLAISWVPGESKDIVYVEVADTSGQQLLLCAARDEAGTTDVPAELLPRTGRVTLGVHRLRTAPFRAEGLTFAELRFDFQVQADVSFQ